MYDIVCVLRIRLLFNVSHVMSDKEIYLSFSVSVDSTKLSLFSFFSSLSACLRLCVYVCFCFKIDYIVEHFYLFHMIIL